MPPQDGHYPMLQRTLAALHDLESQITEQTQRFRHGGSTGLLRRNHGCPCRGNGDMDDCGVDRYDALDEADKEAVEYKLSE